jgi:hypothetical protein
MNLFRATIHPVSFWTSLIQVGGWLHVGDGRDHLGVSFDVAVAVDEAE